jgi:hypothetical protein
MQIQLYNKNDALYVGKGTR